MSLSVEAITERYTTALHALSEIANAYLFQGRIKDALRLFQASEQWLSSPETRLKDQMDFLLTYGQFLVYHYYFANQEEGLMDSVVQRGRQAAEVLQDEAGLATALYLIGLTLYYHNLTGSGDDYTEARNYFKQSSALREKIGDLYSLADSLFYTGLTYERHDQEIEAQHYYQRVLPLAEQYGNALAASEAFRHLAALNIWPATDSLPKNQEQALHYALRSLALRKEIGFKPYWPSAQLLISDIYVELGDLEQALDYCQQAEQLCQEMDQQNYLIQVLLTRGTIVYKQGQRDVARTYFEQADMLARKLNIAYYIVEAREKLEMLAREPKS